jgi:hypothetical protein
MGEANSASSSTCGKEPRSHAVLRQVMATPIIIDALMSSLVIHFIYPAPAGHETETTRKLLVVPP